MASGINLIEKPARSDKSHDETDLVIDRRQISEGIEFGRLDEPSVRI
jgi:hypothetical protein